MLSCWVCAAQAVEECVSASRLCSSSSVLGRVPPPTRAPAAACKHSGTRASGSRLEPWQAAATATSLMFRQSCGVVCGAAAVTSVAVLALCQLSSQTAALHSLLTRAPQVINRHHVLVADRKRLVNGRRRSHKHCCTVQASVQASVHPPSSSTAPQHPVLS